MNNEDYKRNKQGIKNWIKNLVNISVGSGSYLQRIIKVAQKGIAKSNAMFSNTRIYQ